MNQGLHALPPRIAAPAARVAGDTRAMRIMIVSDAWSPQINGVVITLRNTIRELEAQGHTVATITPDGFKSIPCPTYPEIRLIDKVLYCNCGDWVESLTALVEAHDGTLSILRWQDMVAAGTLAPTPAASIGAAATV
jgi:hypothetical protein